MCALGVRTVVGWTRFAVIVPALAAMVGALLLMAQGSLAIVMFVIETVSSQLSLETSVIGILTAVDAVLLGTVLLVIGYGLYELFVGTDINVPPWLKIKDLEDLKSKLVGVVVAIIAVVFVGDLVDGDAGDELLGYGIGTGAVIAGLAIFVWASKRAHTSK